SSHHRAPHPFPTRRSSDLTCRRAVEQLVVQASDQRVGGGALVELYFAARRSLDDVVQRSLKLERIARRIDRFTAREALEFLRDRRDDADADHESLDVLVKAPTVELERHALVALGRPAARRNHSI